MYAVASATGKTKLPLTGMGMESEETGSSAVGIISLKHLS